MSDLFSAAICLKILIPWDGLQRYVSNVVMNVNIFLFVTSIATPFSFDLILENVSKILGIQGNSDNYFLPTDMSNLLFKAICLKIVIPLSDLQGTCRMLS